MANQHAKTPSVVAYRSTGTPLYFLGRILCLTPFGQDFSQSPLASLCSLGAVAFILVTMQRFLVLTVMMFHSGGYPLTIFLSSIALTVTAGISTILSVLWTAVRARNDFKAIDTLLETVDRNLASIGADHPLRPSRTTLILTVSSVTVIALNTHDVVYYGGVLTESLSVRYFTFLTSVYNMVHFLSLVDALGERYRRINTWMELEVGTGRESRSEEHVPVEPKHDGWFIGEDDRLRNLIKPQISETPTSLLRHLRISHHLLHEASLAVNTQFGVRMIGEILHLLVSLVGYTFFSIAFLVAHRESAISDVTQPINIAITALGWLGINLVALSMMSWSAQTAMDEAKKTAWLIQRRAVDPSICPAYREELLRFSAQMLTTETVFSVCGIFRLDMTLLLSVAATITSYTIILLTS